jgi:integration host factor subunit beta
MNKLDLIEALRKETDISKAEAASVVRTFFDSMAETLTKGGRIEIRGLWSFFVKEYDGYEGRNPMTGEKVQVKSKKLPFFKCGRELRKRVNGEG